MDFLRLEPAKHARPDCSLTQNSYYIVYRYKVRGLLIDEYSHRSPYTMTNKNNVTISEV